MVFNWRTTMVGFTWRKTDGLRTRNDSGGHQMEKDSGEIQTKTRVVSFRWNRQWWA